MAKVKFGIVGCGKIVDCNHIPEILSLDGEAEITAMYDRKPGVAAAMAAKHGLNPRICKSLAELLASDIDSVIIATPNSFHLPQTLECLKAGKHVLVEKPMASTIADADKMINTARKAGLVLHVNQSLRFSSLYSEIKRLIDGGAIGKPLHIRCQRAAYDSPDVAWSPGATWFVKKRYEGSLVTDTAVHMADIMQWYFGKVRSIYAVNRNRSHEVTDNVAAVLDFANGATGTLELSWTFPFNSGALEIYGDTGAIKILPDGSGVEVFDCNGKAVQTIKSAELPPITNSHGAFVNAVEMGLESWQYGREALALCMAISESSISGKAEKPKYRGKK